MMDKRDCLICCCCPRDRNERQRARLKGGFCRRAWGSLQTSKLETRFQNLGKVVGDCQDFGDSRLCFRGFKGTITYWLNLETRNSISELKNTFPGHDPYPGLSPWRLRIAASMSSKGWGYRSMYIYLSRLSTLSYVVLFSSV